MLDATQIHHAAHTLLDSARTMTPTTKLSQVHPTIELSDAYRISIEVAKEKIKRGGVVKGQKIGITSKPMQLTAGIDEPDYGYLFGDMFVPEGAVVPPERLIRPFVEAEIAFVLKETIRGPHVTAADVIRATDFVLPAIEVPDTRFVRDGASHIADTIADNASTGLVVLGGNPRRLTDLDIRKIGVTLTVNGIIEQTGVSAAVMGNPINTVAWLANKLHEFDTVLEAGHVVLSGSFIGMLRIRPGDVVSADFDGLGTVGLTIGQS